MSNKKRFSKANVIAALRERAAWYEKAYGFTDNTGTAQLVAGWNPSPGQHGLDKHTKAGLRQQRAIAYGQWIECMCLATWIENGTFPTEN